MRGDRNAGARALLARTYATQGSNPGLADPRQACHSHVRASPWTGDVRLERCEFAQLDSIALALDRGAQRTLVRDCLFRDVGGAAYQLGRWDSADEADASRQERDNTLHNSLVADVGAEFRGAAAVQVLPRGTCLTPNPALRPDPAGLLRGTCLTPTLTLSPDAP